MLLLKHFKSNVSQLRSIPNLKNSIRTNSNAVNLKEKPNRKVIDRNIISSDLIKLLDKHHSSILYSSFVEERRKDLGFIHRRKTISLGKFLEQKEQIRIQLKAQSQEPLPLCLKYITNEDVTNSNTNKANEKSVETEDTQPTHFPFKEVVDTVAESSIKKEEVDTKSFEDRTVALEAEVRFRQETCTDEKVMNWMMDYDNYDDNVEEEGAGESWRFNYGTPDPKSPISNVPCGGCGALLHCKDTAIPGYIPSEIYRNNEKAGSINLQGSICQRCHFLKHYNIALQARVSPEDYPKILQTIKHRRALVILMVDLLDFPCSIWPGIADILGEKPIVVVGNKIDLLPQDGPLFLKHVRKVLLETVKLSGFVMSDIKHVELVSARTGFGIEELITKLFRLWRTPGDVYIVGCTNVGKSTLFNMLLQSDFCKVQAADLIQRATTSPWPGTTLNLLKFPILRPSASRIQQRNNRLSSLRKLAEQQKELRKWHYKNTRNPEYATLIGHIGKTFTGNKATEEPADVFGVKQNPSGLGREIFGINEKNNDFKFSRWCYDTPGVVQPDQIVHLLTTEELMLTLPKTIIQPKTFSIKPGTTIFLGGLARFDYIRGAEFIKCVVFTSDLIPITICKSEDAEAIYNEFLGTEVFKVPMNSPGRLEKWLQLEPSREMLITSTDNNIASRDIVLSNAGWISVVGKRQHDYFVKGWTPEGRGVFLRSSLLPNAVQFRGNKICGSPAYVSDKLYIG